MLKVCSLGLALAGLFVCFTGSAQYANSVISYTGGIGGNPLLTDPTRALGAPTGFIGYQDADPFNPPYAASDLVSLGEGGSLTLQFSNPVLNSPTHQYGLDFLIFGNAGFIITNQNYSGGGITDGSLFANNVDATRVWVSADNLTYYLLNPALAPTVDTLFPTDAAGDFSRPVNPAVTAGDFAGKDLAGIRSLYNGSGGGTGYDISWAQDGNGQSVFLASISFVRIDVLGDKSEIDALVGVPEPGTWVLAGLAAGFVVWHARRNAGRIRC